MLPWLLVCSTLTEAARSAHESARLKHQMMLDPQVPAATAHSSSSSRAQKLQRQQRLAQQVERYAAAQHKRSEHRMSWPGFATSVHSSSPIARALRQEDTESARSYDTFEPLLPPDSCFHSEQQLVHVVVDLDCSSHTVLDLNNTALEAKVSVYLAVCGALQSPDCSGSTPACEVQQ